MAANTHTIACIIYTQRSKLLACKAHETSYTLLGLIVSKCDGFIKTCSDSAHIHQSSVHTLTYKIRTHIHIKYKSLYYGENGKHIAQKIITCDKMTWKIIVLTWIVCARRCHYALCFYCRYFCNAYCCWYAWKPRLQLTWMWTNVHFCGHTQQQYVAKVAVIVENVFIFMVIKLLRIWYKASLPLSLSCGMPHICWYMYVCV